MALYNILAVSVSNLRLLDKLLTIFLVEIKIKVFIQTRFVFVLEKFILFEYEFCSCNISRYVAAKGITCLSGVVHLFCFEEIG